MGSYDLALHEITSLKMKAVKHQESTDYDFRSPFILAATEKNSQDVEKLLLQRALIMKDEKIRNLEKRIVELGESLKEAEAKAVSSKETKTEIVIVNNYFNFNTVQCCALIFLFGVFKLFR